MQRAKGGGIEEWFIHPKALEKIASKISVNIHTH